MNAGEFAKRRARIESSTRRGKKYPGKAFLALEREAGAGRVYSRGKLVAWHLPNGQVVCRKRRYRNEGDAVTAMKTMQSHPNTNKVPCRWYRCGFCNGWHLTSHK